MVADLAGHIGGIPSVLARAINYGFRVDTCRCSIEASRFRIDKSLVAHGSISQVCQ